MEYPNAIGFVILKLSGLKMRVTTFKKKKIAGTSYGICHSNLVTNLFRLLPGRYAIVPFTHEMLQFSTEYTLFAQYKKGSVEFEVNDLLKERPIDTVISDDEEEEAVEGSGMDKNGKVVAVELFGIPEEAPDEPWIWKEDFEEQGILSIYEQVGDLAKQMRLLRTQIKIMDHDVMEMRLRAEEGGKKALDKAGQEDMRRHGR
jgi:hypothetical protein